MKGCVVAAALLMLGPACNCSSTECVEGGDAGSTPRAFGEPCGDRVACAEGLACVFAANSDGSDIELCARGCDAGTCGAGEVYSDDHCLPACTTDVDCASGVYSRACKQ